MQQTVQAVEPFLSTLYGQLVVGLVSGLLSSLLIFLSTTVINDSVVPWFQRRFYRGLLVSGTWRGERNDGGRIYGFSLNVKQSGHVLSGTFAAMNTNQDGSKTNKIYKISGAISNNCVMLNYDPINNKVYGGGSFLFQIFTAGKELRGGMLFMRTTSVEVRAIDDLILVREDE